MKLVLSIKLIKIIVWYILGIKRALKKEAKLKKKSIKQKKKLL